MNANEKIDLTSIALHWVAAVSIISMLVMGFYMKYLPNFNVYDVHKSFGILLCLLLLYRVARRLAQGWPTPVREYQKFEVVLSKIVHWGLMVSMLMMPLSGMLLSAASGHGFGVFGIRLFPSNHNDAGEVVAFSETLYTLGTSLHGVFGFLISGLVTLHITGALKHHFIDRDLTLKRMLGKSIG